jgi:hypothetical protein
MNGSKHQIVAALHILLARMHLYIAGVRHLTDEEYVLIEEITEFMERRKASN